MQKLWKDGLSKETPLESCIMSKDDISFSRKHDLFFERKNERLSFSKKYMGI